MSINIIENIIEVLKESVKRKESIIINNVLVVNGVEITVDASYEDYKIKVVHDNRSSNYVVTFFTKRDNGTIIKTKYNKSGGDIEELINVYLNDLCGESFSVKEREDKVKTTLNKMDEDTLKMMRDFHSMTEEQREDWRTKAYKEKSFCSDKKHLKTGKVSLDEYIKECGHCYKL